MSRTNALPLLLFAAARAGGPRPDADLAQCTDGELLVEAVSPAANSPGYARYDDGYRPRVLALLAQRLKWAPEDASRIADRRIWIGATAEQVVAAWGKPARRSAMTTAAGTDEVWTYGDVLGPHTMVTIRGNRCTSWTRSE